MTDLQIDEQLRRSVHALADASPTPPPYPTSSQPRRLVARGPAIALGAAVAVLVIVGGLLVVRDGASSRPADSAPSTLAPTGTTVVPETTTPGTTLDEGGPTDTTQFTLTRFEGLPSLQGAEMKEVFATADGFVATGWVNVVTADGWTSTPAVWASANGSDWSRVTVDPAPSAVTQTSSGFLGIGCTPDGSFAWTSSDGIGWESTVVPGDPFCASEGWLQTTAIDALAIGGPGFVAVGWEAGTGTSNALVWISPDGVEWSRVTEDDLVSTDADGHLLEMYDVVSVGSRLIAVGSAGHSSCAMSDCLNTRPAVWTSVDGMEWVRLDDSEIGEPASSGYVGLMGIAASDSGDLLVFGWTNQGDVVRSFGGIDWQPSDTGLMDDAIPADAAFDGDLVVAVGSRMPSGSGIWVSNDVGRSWESVNVDDPALESVGGLDQVMTSIVRASDGSFLVVGFESGNLGTNGLVWLVLSE